MKKNFLALLCVGAFALSGCGAEEPDNTQTPTPPSSETGGEGDIKETPKQKFVRAKTKTYENSIYEYTYEISAGIKFAGALQFSPVNFSGTVQFDASDPETQYMEKKTASGLLVFDYTTYTYNKGTDLITINADENKKFSIVDNKQIPSGYDFETNAVGFVLKALADNDNLSINKSGEKYNIALKTSFKSPFLSLLNIIDSQKIIETLSDLTESKWGVGFSSECYAKLDSEEDHVTDFHLGVNVNVKDTVEINLALDQHFTKVGKDVKIELPQFENTFVSESDINTQLGTLNSAMEASKNSYYKYDLHTKVDHGVSKGNPLGMGVDSHSRGYAERAMIGEKVYFHNGLEFDSDYKNKDQYGEEVEDYKYTRAKVNDGNDTVYDVIDGVLKNTYLERKNYNNDDIDDYYMLFNFGWVDAQDVKLVRKTTKDDETTFELGVSSSAIKSTLEKFNKQIRVDSDEQLAINVFDIKSSFEPRKSVVKFVMKNNKLSDIEMKFKGFFVDNKTSKQIKFECDYAVEFDHEHKAYSIPTDQKGIELPNFSVIL